MDRVLQGTAEKRYRVMMGRREQFLWPDPIGDSGNETRKIVGQYYLGLDAWGCSWRLWGALKTFE